MTVVVVPVWPIELLMPEKPNWELAGGYVSGGAQNQQGWVQRGVYGGGGTWRLTMTRIVIDDDFEKRLSWRGFQANLDSGASPVIIRIPDFAGIEQLYPEGDEDPGPPLEGQPFGDGTLFSDGAEWGEYDVTVQCVGGADMNATTMEVEVIAGPALRPGLVFSVLDEQGLDRKHMIRAATAEGSPVGRYSITFRPWLRAAIADGAELNFSNPGCVMKLAEPGSIFAEETGGRWAEPSPIFEEWFGAIPT